MAGAITHLLVASEALKLIDGMCPEMAEILRENYPLLLLGSVSPDLPYAMAIKPLSGAQVWAERMHNLRTGGVGVEGAGMLSRKQSLDKLEYKAQIAWLSGYISHCVADATIHPIVQAIVGAYQFAKTQHRVCEMIQDSLLFNEVYGYDLEGTKLIDELKKVDRNSFIYVANFWFILLARVYPGMGSTPEPQSWHKPYLKLLNIAKDNALAQNLSRVVPDLKDYLYPTAKALRKARQKESRIYFDEVPFPNDPQQKRAFNDIGFQQAVKNVLPIWQSLDKEIRSSRKSSKQLLEGGLKGILKNWNLDTGADMDIPDDRITYWPGAIST
jgi:hypothetical protein